LQAREIYDFGDLEYFIFGASEAEQTKHFVFVGFDCDAVRNVVSSVPKWSFEGM